MGLFNVLLRQTPKTDKGCDMVKFMKSKDREWTAEHREFFDDDGYERHRAKCLEMLKTDEKYLGTELPELLDVASRTSRDYLDKAKSVALPNYILGSDSDGRTVFADYSDAGSLLKVYVSPSSACELESS